MLLKVAETNRGFLFPRTRSGHGDPSTSRRRRRLRSSAQSFLHLGSSERLGHVLPPGAAHRRAVVIAGCKRPRREILRSFAIDSEGNGELASKVNVRNAGEADVFSITDCYQCIPPCDTVKAREVESTHDYPALEASTEFAVAVVSDENHAPQFAAGPTILGQVSQVQP